MEIVACVCSLMLMYQNDLAAVETVQLVAQDLARRRDLAAAAGHPPRDPRRTHVSPVTERDVSRTPSAPRR